MEGKGFVVKNMKTQHVYVVRDSSQVSDLIGFVDTSIIQRWFYGNAKLHIYKGWRITKGYEIPKEYNV